MNRVVRTFETRITDPDEYPLSRQLAVQGNLRLAALDADAAMDPSGAQFYRGRLELVTAEITRREHDSGCENLPGGEYHGKMIGGLPIPCHCPARAAGRARAEREIKREERSS